MKGVMTYLYLDIKNYIYLENWKFGNSLLKLINFVNKNPKNMKVITIKLCSLSLLGYLYIVFFFLRNKAAHTTTNIRE